MRRYALAFAMLWLGGAASAQDDGLQALQNQLSIAALDSGTFVQQRELSLFPQPLTSRGRFAHVRDHGLLWQVLEPVQSDLRILNSQVQQRRPDGDWSPPLLGAQGSQVAAQLLTSLLAADLEGLKSHFVLQAQSAEQGWVLQLQPHDAAVQSMLASARVRGGEQVEDLLIRFASGESMQIELQHDAKPRLTPAQEQALALD